MNTYPLLQLGDIADVVAGDPAPQDPEAFAPNGPLFVRMQDVGRYHRHPALSDSTDRLNPEWVARSRLRLFPRDSTLIPKSGASVNLNHRAKLAIDAYVVSHLAVVIPDRTRIDPDYLYWWAGNYDPRAQAQVTSLPSLKLSTLKSARVPLPPLDEQRRIVSILNRAAKIGRLRTRAQVLIGEFISALFVKMFGDPVENPMGWDIRLLGDIVQGFQGGKNVQAGSGESEYRILKVSAVTNGYFNPSMSKPAPDNYIPPNDHVVLPGDLLISRANTSALVGATAMVDDVSSNFLLPDKIWRFVWRENSIIDSVYIHNLLKTEFMRSCLGAMATGTSGSMKNISQEKLKTLPVLVPPIDEQRRFTRLVAFARAAYKLGESGSNNGWVLSASLMSRLLRDGA